MRFISIIVLAITLATSLIACGNKPDAAALKNSIRVGTMAGPETDLMQVAKVYAAKHDDLNIKIVTFSDYTMPNIALNEGSIDANMFQHKPYLHAFLKANRFPIIEIAKTFVYPMALYSKKYKSVNAIPDGASIAIPNDPTNEARALLLCQKAGLITLKPGTGYDATPLDIKMNKKQLQFKELDAAQLPRSLEDVDVAAINANYSLLANLFPYRDGLLAEGKRSSYANLIVVRKKDRNNPKLLALVKAMHSKPVLAKAKKLFKGAAIAAW